MVHRQPAIADRIGQHRHGGEVVGAAQSRRARGSDVEVSRAEARRRRSGSRLIATHHADPIARRTVAVAASRRCRARCSPDRQVVQGIVGEGVDVDGSEGVDHVVELVDDPGPHAMILSNWCTRRQPVSRRCLVRFRPLSPPDASGRANRTAGSQPAGRTHSGPATATSQRSARESVPSSRRAAGPRSRTSVRDRRSSHARSHRRQPQPLPMGQLVSTGLRRIRPRSDPTARELPAAPPYTRRVRRARGRLGVGRWGTGGTTVVAS